MPLAFQGALGATVMLDSRIVDGSGVGVAMVHIVGGGVWIGNAIVIMLMLSILLIVMTSMMGSSRTLYQASVDGWLPRFLSHTNEHGAPTRAMWTDLVFNLVLLLSDYMTVLSISNVCYMLFVFLNLQSGWIHRLDRGNWERPFRCPNWLLALGALCGYANIAFIGAGAGHAGRGHDAQRPDRHAADRAGVRVSPLLAGQGALSRVHGRGHPFRATRVRRPRYYDALPFAALLLVAAVLWCAAHCTAVFPAH